MWMAADSMVLGGACRLKLCRCPIPFNNQTTRRAGSSWHNPECWFLPGWDAGASGQVGRRTGPSVDPQREKLSASAIRFNLHFVHNPACISFTAVSTMPCHGMSFAATDFKEDNQAVTCDSDLSNAKKIGFEPGGLRSECCWQACMFKYNVNFTMFQTSTL